MDHLNYLYKSSWKPRLNVSDKNQNKCSNVSFIMHDNITTSVGPSEVVLSVKII